jgi:type II secretory pathway pseudopilin PulG
VIAIIATLAVILFPVFAQAREKARQAACMSNLKQLNLAVKQYVQDYDGRFNRSIQPADPANTPPGGYWERFYWIWPQIVYPYHKSIEVFNCPNGVRAYAKQPRVGHYGANWDVMGDYTTPDKPTSEADIVSSANTYLIFDAGQYVLSYAEARSASRNVRYLPGGKEGGRRARSPEAPAGLSTSSPRRRAPSGRTSSAAGTPGASTWVSPTGT